MIIIKPNECILKPKVTLYNNLARSGRCKGRLLVELEIYPSPRVVWEFESLGNTACEPKGSSSRLLENPFIGSRFRMDRPYVTNLSWGTLTGSPRIALIGFSPRISLGENEFKGHSFTFLLPNAKYQEQNYFGQTNLINVLKVGQGEDAKEIIEDFGGKSITFPIDNYWQIHLETRKDALTWLENKQRKMMEIMECEILPDGTRNFRTLFRFRITENRMDGDKFIINGHHEQVRRISDSLQKRFLENGMPQEVLDRLAKGGAA